MSAALAAKALCRAVRTGDQITARRVLDRPDLAAVALELARTMPPPRTPRREPTPRLWQDPATLTPCGSHAAFNRHKEHGEHPCEDCKAAEKAYQAARMRRRRSQSGVALRPAEPIIDRVAVDRVLAGEDVLLSEDEKRVAAGLLVAAGVSANAAAIRVHAHPRKVRAWVDTPSVGAGSTNLSDPCCPLPHTDDKKAV